MTPQFGNLTGMRLQGYDFLYHHMSFSSQPKEQGDLAYKTWSWMLIDDFVKAFNDNCASQIMVSNGLCVDESFSCWYDRGGSYISIGLPCYIKMDRKLKDSCKIWSCCDGRTGIMLQLKIVKTPTELELQELQDDNKKLNHGSEVLQDLVKPWKNTNRIVCADSYFASVQVANKLLNGRCSLLESSRTPIKIIQWNY
jgi:Transposase IS4